MSNINWDSIKKKAEDYLSSPAGRKRVEETVEMIMLGRISFGAGAVGSRKRKTPAEAASKFCEVLRRTLMDCVGSDYADGDISQEAATAIDNLGYDKPYRVGDKYYMDIFFRGDKHRESLVPDSYDGVNNIIALLNKGYPTDGRSRIHAVKGVWVGHGDEERYSLTHRSGAHFIEQAVDNFMGNYGTDYGVLDIEVSSEYTNKS